MITFKPVLVSGNKRKDGTRPLKIRITFNRRSVRIPTTIAAMDADLTRSGNIKNPVLLERAQELIAKMRAACSDLSFYALETMTVEDVAQHIKDRLSEDKFSLDFFAYGEEFMQSKRETTRRSYVLALNALERFLGRRQLDINEITRKLILDFQAYIDKEPKMRKNRSGTMVTVKKKRVAGVSGFYTGKLYKIFNDAKFRYNDDDAGRIVIPRSPFDGLNKSYPPSHGPEALDVETIQRIIDARPENPREAVALAYFLISFATMGANMADLFAATVPSGDVWRYYRQKTTRRRVDKAEMRVRITPQLRALMARVNKGCGRSRFWLPGLQQWAHKDSATAAINEQMRHWAEREGLEPFSFGAARHSWGTIARRIGVEKATVDEALVHVGDFRVTDIYASRNWELAWEANDRVLALFRWENLAK